MEVLTKKYHGLPGYAWVGVVAAGAFIYFRFFAGAGASNNQTASDSGGNDASTAGGQGFDQGFATGFAQGNYAGQIQPSPPPGTNNCRSMKDPSGRIQTVCGSGHFVAGTGINPTYKWVSGAGKTIYGYGLKGRPFYNLNNWKRAVAARRNKATKPGKRISNVSMHGGSVPVNQHPIAHR